MAFVHEGHRERMRERIAKSGIDSLQNHEILEYLLYAFVPRKDTNEIAHRLIAEFGSFSGVLNADPEHLLAVSGVTYAAALFLSNLPEIFRRYAVDTDTVRESMRGRGKAREHMRKMLYGRPVEQVYMAALDSQDKLIKYEMLSKGSGDSVYVSIRDVVDFGMKYRASGMLLAHNHPSGFAKPSQQDYEMTKEIVWTLKGVGITLQDHYVFSGNECYSFEENGLLNRIMKDREATFKEGAFYYD